MVFLRAVFGGVADEYDRGVVGTSERARAADDSFGDQVRPIVRVHVVVQLGLSDATTRAVRAEQQRVMIEECVMRDLGRRIRRLLEAERAGEERRREGGMSAAL